MPGSYTVESRVAPSRDERRPPGTVRSKPINTARGTPAEPADLRLYLLLGKPRCREAPRSVGPSGPRRSACPRIISGQPDGLFTYGAPGADQTIRAAQRWLYSK